MGKANQDIAAPGRVKEITSQANPAIKEIRALFQKKYRDRQRIFIAEGRKLIVDALDQGWTIRTLVYAKAAGAEFETTAARAVAAGGDALIVPEKLLSAITRRDNPQMVIGVFEQRFKALETIAAKQSEVWVGLDRVRDPGNLGTVIRTVDAAGAKGVVLIGDCTDPYAPEAVRATMGSIFSVPVVKCTEDAFCQWRPRYSGLVAGTHLAGSVDYRTVDYTDRPLMLLMGNEQKGLSERLAGQCDVLVRIPQAGKADSLNLAVSTGVVLFEARRAALVLGDDGDTQ